MLSMMQLSLSAQNRMVCYSLSDLPRVIYELEDERLLTRAKILLFLQTRRDLLPHLKLRISRFQKRAENKLISEAILLDAINDAVKFKRAKPNGVLLAFRLAASDISVSALVRDDAITVP